MSFERDCFAKHRNDWLARMGRRNTQIESVAQEYVSGISNTISVDGVFLFGSYARGDERKDSDVDLVVLSPNFETMNFIESDDFAFQNA